MGDGYTRGPHIPSPLFPLLKLGEGVQDESGLGRWRIEVQTPPRSPEVGDERLEVGQGSLLLGKREAQFKRSARPRGARGRERKDDLIFFFLLKRR